MRLRTQFLAAMVFFCAILAVVAASTIIINQKRDRARDQELIAAGIASGANELSYLAHDYLIYGEHQQLRRWQSRFASFSGQVDLLRVENPPQLALVADMQANQRRLKAVFEGAVAARKSAAGTAIPFDPALLQVSWSRIAIQTQSLVSNATHLSKLLHRRMDELNETRTMLMYVMLGLMGLILLVSYMLTYRRILGSIRALQTGTKIVGSGNLDFVIREERTDEIGDLSRAFNRMTTDLKVVTASKTDLEREIAERERVESALRESEQRWATTLTSIGDAVIATDAAGKITFMNPVAEELTGWKLMDATTKSVPEVFHIINEHTRREVENPVAKVLREEMVVGLANHTILVRKDGTEVPIDDSGAPIRDKDGKTTGVVLVFRDITERKQAEERLKENRARLDLAVESASMGVWHWDLVEDRRSFDEQACYLLGIEPATFTGRADEFFGAVHPDDREMLKAALGRTIEQGVPYGPEYRAVWPDGSVHYIAARGRLVRHDASNRPERINGVIWDITDRKRTEEALREAHDELEKRIEERTAELRQAYNRLRDETREREKAEAQLRQAQKMEALGTLSGGIAHDFNNILSAIIGFTELIGDHLPDGSRETRHVKRVLEAGIRGRDLVRQMLAFSRKGEQEKKPLRVSSIVEETVKLIRATIPTTIVIRVDVVSESKLIFADPTQIQQVLMNLCTNAAFAMRETGGILDVQLSDHGVSPSNGDLDGMRPGLYTRLTVRDAGTGIAPDVMDKIFDPFFTTKKLGEGTGLGLSVVHGIVRQHDGYITVASEPGNGSIFTVYLPQIAGEFGADAVSDDEIPTGLERILFVDDEEALVEMGEKILGGLGYDVVFRTSSRGALALVTADPSRFDLVITDQTMPEMTGIELTQEILTIRPDMPIIMCTGFSHLVNEESARQAGINAFVMKPFTKREIAKTVRDVLDR